MVAHTHARSWCSQAQSYLQILLASPEPLYCPCPPGWIPGHLNCPMGPLLAWSSAVPQALHICSSSCTSTALSDWYPVPAWIYWWIHTIFIPTRTEGDTDTLPQQLAEGTQVPSPDTLLPHTPWNNFDPLIGVLRVCQTVKLGTNNLLCWGKFTAIMKLCSQSSWFCSLIF